MESLKTAANNARLAASLAMRGLLVGPAAARGPPSPALMQPSRRPPPDAHSPPPAGATLAAAGGDVRSSKRLTESIMNCPSAEAVLDTIYATSSTEAARVSTHNVSAAFSALLNHARRSTTTLCSRSAAWPFSTDRRFGYLLSLASSIAFSDVRAASTILLVCGKQQIPLPAAWLLQYWSSTLVRCELGDAQQFSNILFAHSLLRIMPPPAYASRFWAAAIRVAGDCTPQNIANSLLACATLNILPPPTWFEIIVGVSRRALLEGKWTIQNLSNSLHALSHIEFFRDSALTTLLWDELLLQIRRDDAGTVPTVTVAGTELLALPRDHGTVAMLAQLVQTHIASKLLGSVAAKPLLLPLPAALLEHAVTVVREATADKADKISSLSREVSAVFVAAGVFHEMEYECGSSGRKVDIALRRPASFLSWARAVRARRRNQEPAVLLRTESGAGEDSPTTRTTRSPQLLPVVMPLPASLAPAHQATKRLAEEVPLHTCSSGAESVAFEVDGPSHYGVSGVDGALALLGASIQRNRLLSAAGWVVVVIPFVSWSTSENKEALIVDLYDAAMAAQMSEGRIMMNTTADKPEQEREGGGHNKRRRLLPTTTTCY